MVMNVQTMVKNKQKNIPIMRSLIKFQTEGIMKVEILFKFTNFYFSEKYKLLFYWKVV